MAQDKGTATDLPRQDEDEVDPEKAGLTPAQVQQALKMTRK